MQGKWTVMAKKVMLSGVLVSALPVVATAASPELQMSPGVLGASEQVFRLQGMVFWGGVLAVAMVLGLAGWLFWQHRARPGDESSGRAVSEVLWLLVPVLVLLALAVPAARLLTALSQPDGNDLTIRVTGKQWRWHYDYLADGADRQLGLSYDSALVGTGKDADVLGVDRPLVIPSGRRVRLLMEAEDGVHSWWVPDLGVREQAVPGYVNEFWIEVPAGKEGRYLGRCGELCSRQKDFMPVVVEAVAEQAYRKWLNSEKVRIAAWQAQEQVAIRQRFASLQQAVSQGEQVYQKHCAICHQRDGGGMKGMAPALNAGASGKGLSRRDYFRIVVDGAGAMPGGRGVMLSSEMAAVLTYVRNAWGLSPGDLVQPGDVAAYQKVY